MELKTKWLTVKEFSEYFGISEGDVAYWCRTGELETLPREGRQPWRINSDEIARIEQQGLPLGRRQANRY